MAESGKKNVIVESAKQFDGVSFVNQNKKEIIFDLRLSAMKTERSGFPPKQKPKNTRGLPYAEMTDELMVVTAILKDGGEPETTYQWVKRRQDLISNCKIKVGQEKLEVILTKTSSKEWLQSSIEYFLEL